MKTYQLTISSPEGNLFKGEVGRLILRGAAGDLAVLAGHIPFITSITPGDVEIMMEDESIKKAHATGGLLTVDKEAVTVLTSGFTWVE